MLLSSPNLIALHDVTIQSANNALAAITLEVPKNSRFAVLGLPGAGKTMLVKTLAGLTTIVRGSGSILGYPLGDSRITTSGQIGFLHQGASWPDGLTVIESLHLLARQHAPHTPLADLAALAGLENRQHINVAALSAGERRRLALVALHLRNPDLLILDDPAGALIEADRAAVLDHIAQMSAGRTLLFTTSRLDEAKRLATHGALLHQESILASGAVDTFLSAPEATIFRVVLRGDTSVVYEHIRDLAWIKEIQATSEGSITTWTITLLGQEATPTNLLRAILADRSLDVVQFKVLRPRIDHLLAELALRAAQQSHAASATWPMV